MQNVIVYSLGEEHDNDCKNAFLNGYQSNGARYSGNIDIIEFFNLDDALNFAASNDYQFIIYSAFGGESLSAIANNYYSDVICFFPAGSNEHKQVFYQSVINNKISAIITGCRNEKGNNITGYNVEFIDQDPITQNNYSSYSNAYICGKFAYIKDYLKANNWQTRYICRQTASLINDFTDENGFGVIDVNSAISSYIEIPEETILSLGKIGNLTTYRIENQVYISIDEVENANNYKIYRNDELIYSGANLDYIDTISPQGNFTYKYKASNNLHQTNFSNEDKIIYRAYTSFFIQ